MNKIKVSYADVPNMGDLLNIYIVRDFFGCEFQHATSVNADLSGIGSGLGGYTLTDEVGIKKLAKKIVSLASPTVHIWGTGFIENKDWDKFYRKNVVFNAVRGNLTKQKVEEILGHTLDIPTGDGGILAAELFNEKIEKQYEIGIIPHFKEQSHDAFKELKEKFPNAKLINLRDEPLKVIRDIGSCEFIISSSLHGLIVADSFNIPNHHVVVTNNLLGDGFKFDDYYSGFDVPHIFTNIVNNGIDKIDKKFIKENYMLNKDMVQKNKNELIEAFPFKGSMK